MIKGEKETFRLHRTGPGPSFFVAGSSGGTKLLESGLSAVLSLSSKFPPTPQPPILFSLPLGRLFFFEMICSTDFGLDFFSSLAVLAALCMA